MTVERLDVADSFLKMLAGIVVPVSPASRCSDMSNTMNSAILANSQKHRLAVARQFLSGLAGHLIRDPTLHSYLSAPSVSISHLSLGIPDEDDLDSSDISSHGRGISRQHSLTQGPRGRRRAKRRVIVVPAPNAAPCVLYSVISTGIEKDRVVIDYAEDLGTNVRTRNLSIRNISDNEEEFRSFAHLLEPEENWGLGEYDPFYLDDPELTYGRHRTVMNLPCFTGSVISFVTKEQLENELNRQFMLRHPWMSTSLTLTMIREIKFGYTQIYNQLNLSVSTIGYAVVYFEQLVLENQVTKRNRKLLAAICLILGIKFNEFGEEYIASLSESICEYFNIKKSAVFENEFNVTVKLNFNLHVPTAYVMTHMRRMLETYDLAVDSETRDILGHL